MSRILPHLPFAVIIEILSRLPVKPLFRFKCVCKSWLSLISNDPQFAKMHLHYAKQDTTVNRYRLFLNCEHPFQSIDHDAFCNGDNVVARELHCSSIITNLTEFFFLGSCNGLIAVSGKDKCRSDLKIIVWNPSSGDFRELLASDSSIFGVYFGFGYDSHHDDYKVVRVATSTSGSVIKMEVFSLKANKWRSIQDLNSNISLKQSVFSAYNNGFLNWLVPWGDNLDEELGILSFDLGEEQFEEMVRVPDYITQNAGSHAIIQGVRDSLWVFTDVNPEWYEGWIMKRDEGEISWRSLYRIRRDPLPKFEGWLVVIWVAKNGNVLLDVGGEKLVLYNPQEQSSLEYGLNRNGFAAIDYMETLVSPNAA